MSRLATRLEALRADGRTALTTFITAGDPSLEATVPALHCLVEHGADVLELGVPFSDPEAEGPAIQAASERGLANGATLRKCLEMVHRFRADDGDTPVVLMGYLNSVLAMGEETFADAAADAGVDGLIMVNLPPEEAGPLKTALSARDIDLVFLVAPTTTTERAGMITAAGAGFIYYVSLKGITGSGNLDVDQVEQRIAALRRQTDLPLQVGFGIKDPETARTIGRFADGVVIGSALVRTMDECADQDERHQRLAAQVGALRQALDAG